MHLDPRAGWHKAVLVVLLAAAAAAGYAMLDPLARLGADDKALQSATSPRGMASLALAPSADAAQDVIAAWDKGGVLERARELIRYDDDTFAFVYPFFGAALLLFAWTLSFPWESWDGRRAWLVLLGFGLALALLWGADRLENAGLRTLLEDPGRPVASRLLAQTRAASQVKFAALGAFSLGVLTLLGVGARRQWRAAAHARGNEQGVGGREARSSFAPLLSEEWRGILGRNDPVPPEHVGWEAAGEPWLKECREHLVGLALSGGGIRSATFNLGLLQGLHRLGILPCVDYLATVSGGGYVGGFWSAWRAARPGTAQTFPDEYKKSATAEGVSPQFSGDSRVFEAQEVRHLREFGNFLMPRMGFFETETWGAVVSILAGLLPAVAAALSVLALSLIAWLSLTFYLACSRPWGRAFALAGLTGVVLWVLETWWRRHATSEDTRRGRIAQISLLATALVGLGAWHYGNVLHAPTQPVVVGSWPSQGIPLPVLAYQAGQWSVYPQHAPSYEQWWSVIGIGAYSHSFVISLAVLEPAMLWAATALVLLTLRFRGVFQLASPKGRVRRSASDRTTMRLLAMATAWILLATFWHIGLNLARLELAMPTAAGALGTGSLFALLRNWIGTGLTRHSKSRLPDQVRPYIPQLLAYLTVGLAWAAVAGGLIWWGGSDWMRWCLAAVVAGMLALAVLVVDPHEFGMHAFYRDRLCRAYLGGAQEGTAAANRLTDPREQDDVLLKDLPARPLHLVCCAANHLSGDHLSTLSRGARSAVLSRNGVAMGDSWARQDGLYLGSAVTASAAAFNSNMGSVSMRVGPAVSFLMAALNLRLGLWVDDPRRPPTRRLLPGWLFYREMFADTSTDGGDLHLSDGAHFDNLGLYELVRRHCRYVIVSDCGADPEVAFDDFGNAARRIREDFGVEIDIDLGPLRPKDGCSAQHAVVGTIDYGWFDKGILVYIKPTLTGSEVPDIRQYKTRNPAFPHESTGDQFYDEAQWESYRRLGVHSARSAFGLAEKIPAAEGFVDPRRSQWIQHVFGAVRQDFYAAPLGLEDKILAMTQRFESLERELKGKDAPSIVLEIFPEVEHAGRPQPTRSAPTEEMDIANLDCLVRAIQLMEDTYFACLLERYWSHPLNLGWVNLFARWSTAPTFRTWWPLLKPLYSPAFRAFVEGRFAVLRGPAKGGVVKRGPKPGTPPAGLAATWWQDRDPFPHDVSDRTFFEYAIELPVRKAAVQVALVAVRLDGDGKRASWTSDHFFVPLSLWGGGIGQSFLKALLAKLKEEQVAEAEVTVEGPPASTAGAAQWEERRGYVEFYRSNGFVLEAVSKEASGKGASQHKAVLVRQL